MVRQIASVQCTGVIARVSLGFYDEEGHLVGEETFPQVDGTVGAAKLFYPHADQLASLIESCVAQAWGQLTASGRAYRPGMPLADVAQARAESETDGAGPRPMFLRVAEGENNHGSPG